MSIVKSVRTVPVTQHLAPIIRYRIGEDGFIVTDRDRNNILDRSQCRDAVSITTHVTTCTSQTVGPKGKGKMTTVRLFGIQGVAEQPTYLPRPKCTRGDREPEAVLAQLVEMLS